MASWKEHHGKHQIFTTFCRRARRLPHFPLLLDGATWQHEPSCGFTSLYEDLMHLCRLRRSGFGDGLPLATVYGPGSRAPMKRSSSVLCTMKFGTNFPQFKKKTSTEVIATTPELQQPSLPGLWKGIKALDQCTKRQTNKKFATKLHYVELH